MSDGTIGIDLPSTVDLLLDTSVLTVGANSVNRERVVIAGVGATDLCPVDATKGVRVDLTNTGANTNKILVDPSGVTSPVSAAALPLPTGASTVAKQPALGVAGTPSADVITIQGATSMMKLLVTPDSVALPLHQSVNLDEVNGVAVSMGAGLSDTGTQRVALSYDGAVALQASQVSGVVNATTTRTVTTGLGSYADLAIVIALAGGSVATGLLQLFLEDSFDGGTTWQDLVSSNTFAFGAGAITQLFWVAGKIATSGTQGGAAAVETLGAGIARQGPWGDRIRVREKVSGVSGSPTGVTYVISVVATR
jgi:hypothetical protein